MHLIPGPEDTPQSTHPTATLNGALLKVAAHATPQVAAMVGGGAVAFQQGPLSQRRVSRGCVTRH
jgi:hypothetical protein